jgi:hypothetical protein
MKFELRSNARYFSDKELLDDLKRVAGLLSGERLTTAKYEKHGKFCVATYQKRFGSWNKSLEQAGIKINLRQFIPNEDLFDNLEKIWRTVGRQPLYSEMRAPLSKYSTRPYDNRFGNWLSACKEFIKYKKGDTKFIKLVKEKPVLTTRYINEKTRLKILKRDNYKCVKCGRSPATHRELFLHIDHIKPFSKGGDNSMGNLQTLCNKCNLGKGNDEKV